MRLHAAVVQLAPVFGEVDKNLHTLSRMVGEMPDPVDLVVAPELANSGYDLSGLAERGHQLAEPLDGPTVRLAAELAAAREATIVVGLLEAGEGGVLYDTAVVVSPDGAVTPYRKTHLFPLEMPHFMAGDQLLTVSGPGARIGPMICFEHAFPEVATALALQGAQVLVIPSAVPSGFEYVLHLRTRARAQDNQVFAVAANLAGGEYCGRSLIVDPRGEVLVEAGTGEEVIYAELDLDLIERERAKEPALHLRRPELYARYVAEGTHLPMPSGPHHGTA